MQRIVNICKKQRHIENMLRFTTILLLFIGIIPMVMNYNVGIKENSKFIFVAVAIFILLCVLIVCGQIVKIIIGNTIKKEVLAVLEDEIERSEKQIQIKKKYVKAVFDGYIVYISSDIDEYTKQCVNNRLKYLFSILQRVLKKRISVHWI